MTAVEKLEVSFSILGPADAPALAMLVQSQTPAYMRTFHPFPFDEKELSECLKANRQDVWWGIEADGQLAGLVMLRGADEGYEHPAFGILVAEEFAGRGLARQALRHCFAWCRSRGIPKILLKVETANVRARNLYLDEGFELVGVCSASGQDVMEWCVKI